MVKVKGLFKNPWAKDLKKEEADVVNVRDSYGGAVARDSTYDYYEDADERLSVNPNNNRLSTMDAFKQASLFFDYQISSRNLGGKPNSNALRTSTGIVSKQSICLSSCYTDDDEKATPPPAPKRRLAPTSMSKGPHSGRSSAAAAKAKSRGLGPMRSSLSPSLETMTEGDEEEEEEEPAPRIRQRSLSPAKKSASLTRGASAAARPGMTRNNSWTSSRDIQPKPKSKRKKKKGSSKSLGSAASRKKGAGGTDKPRRRKQEGTTTTSKPKRRNRSSSPDTKKVGTGAAARPGMVRRNSWTSSSNLKANTGQMAEKIAKTGAVGELLDAVHEDGGDDDEGSKKSSSSSPKKSTPSKKRAGNKKKTTRGRKKRGSVTSEKEFMAGLRKSRAIAHSISIVSAKDNVDKEEMDMLQKQLQEALDETMRLKDEVDKDQKELGKATEETDELQQLLAQSAKENMELWNKIEGEEESVRENNENMENMTKEVKELREKKAALAETVNKGEQEIKSLQSEINLMRLRNANSDTLSEVCELRETNLEQQQLIDDHTRILRERDAKIQALEDQLKLGPHGDKAQNNFDLTSELDSAKAVLKQSKLDHSVALAKKEAMVTKLQNQLDDQKSGIDQRQNQANSANDDIAATKDKLNEALAKLEATKDMEEKVQQLERLVKDAETMEDGLHSAIDKWTDKAFDWQEKAETMEAELAKLRGGENGSRVEKRDSIEESINAVFGGLFGQSK
jgi:hypothetical protein